MGFIRLFLAIDVMVVHAGITLLDPRGFDVPRGLFGLSGNAAVMYFYVVSGFLISFVLDEKYSTNGGTPRFYRSRFLRIYPLWWTIVAINTLWFGWIPNEPQPPSHVVSVVALFGSDYIQAFSHYPQLTGIFPGPIGVGWSLGVEVAFYALAPLLLRSWKLSLTAFIASVTLRWAVVHYIGVGSPAHNAWNYYSLPGALTFFCLGDLARRLWKGFPIPPIVGVLLLIPSIYYQEHMGWAYDNRAFWRAIILFALALPHVFALTKDSRIMNFCGDLTYPLYITHAILIRFVTDYGYASAFVSLGPRICLIAFGALAIVVALASHWLLERPAIALFDWLLRLSPLRLATDRLPAAPVAQR